jgi:trehalose 6-phosphate synthase
MELKQQRLLIVANRLPITLKPIENGEYDFQTSSGGLVAGLKGLSDKTKFKWFGWPGIEVPRRDIKMLESKLTSDFHAVPIWLSNTLAKHHYNGFSSTFRPCSNFTRVLTCCRRSNLVAYTPRLQGQNGT